MKKLAFLLLWSALAYGQGGNMVVRTDAGAPAGSCAFVSFYINSSNGDFYSCALGVWQLVGGGAGTVTSFSAGTLSPLFTTSVATATTTPALSFTLSNAAAYSYFGNNTGSSAAPAYTNDMKFLTKISFIGATSGTAVVQVAAVAGSPNPIQLPTATGGAGEVLTTDGGNPQQLSWTAAGSGTVTSVSWTGGIVSVATATTTPAFTIAGTSGGIPYFSGATTWASSAALTANAFVFGGGAGTAPSTKAGFTSDGTSIPTFGAAGTGSGAVTFAGTTSGSATIGVADAAGTPARINLPTTTGTANYFLRTDGATPQVTSWQPAPLHYAFGNGASANPADGASQYTGCADVALSATAAINRCLVPRSGTIIRACVMLSVAGTLGSNETGTLAVRLNNSSNTNITTTATWDAVTATFCADISVAVSQGDYFEIQAAYPTWATNPTTVRMFGSVLVL